MFYNLGKRLIFCPKCMSHFNFNLFYKSYYNTSNNKWKTVTKTKEKSEPKLKVKQFPTFLRDLEKHEKRLKLTENKLNEKVIEPLVSDEVIHTNNNEWIDNMSDEAFDLNILTPFDDTNDINNVLVDEYHNTVNQKNNDLRKAVISATIKGKLLSLRSSLKAYMSASIHSDLISRAHSILIHYSSKTFKKKKRLNTDEDQTAVNVSVYNVLLKGWAKKGKTTRIKEIFKLMKSHNVKPNTESFAYYLLSLAQQSNHQTLSQEIYAIFQEMRANNLIPENLFNNCYINTEERDKIMRLLNDVFPYFRPNPPKFPKGYATKLMDPIEGVKQAFFNPLEGIDLNRLNDLAKQQFSIEVNGSASVSSIIAKENKSDNNFYLNKWKEMEKEWRSVLTESFMRHLKTLQIQSNEINEMTIYPYLVVLDAHHYIDSLIEEMRSCISLSENYSPIMTMLYADLGRKIMTKYLIKAKIEDGTAQDFQDLYEKHLDYYRNPEMFRKYSSREYWQKLMTETNHYFNNDIRNKIWPYHVQLGVGYFLYNLILREAKLNVNILRVNSTKKKYVPAFYTVYKSIADRKYKKEIRTHPTLIRLFQNACLGNLMFNIDMLPMLCPPTPWVIPNVGGYLLVSTDFVRFPDSNFRNIFNDYNNQNLYPCFDSLNCLSMCPWIINKKVLDIAMYFFKNKGDLNLSIPKPQSEFSALPKISSGMTRVEKAKLHKQRDVQRRERAEMYSLWCDCLYKLSIANHFRDKVFWFPNNFDFRGRVYPVPPHFNHLGSDLSRGILLFARAQPLGKRGLDWLKIHLVNLTGLKKRSSISDRLEYANQIMPQILDSADNPLDGEKWWTKSEEPWQTLACCIEITNAYRSRDSANYMSHFPVHQDGSCNGLQHYAALGRDQKGAQSVNLHPSQLPQDVYSDVAALVEKERQTDELKGNALAVALKGYVSRKIVKQTVMTYVYGVTPYGARLQIIKRLKETDFPKEQMMFAALYLSQKTFLSIQEMFTATKCIQDWLTECAQVISNDFGKSVQWVTPIGFPVIQPYHKPVSKLGETFFGIDNEINLRYISRSDFFQKPNTMKQKNAFPPNFIHSLDSTHMMLTSIHCHKAGITFASVHDCFWTHASNIEIMNKICRQQFVTLHSEPILDDLSNYLVDYFKDVPNNNFEKSMSVLKKKLEKGSFNLDNILSSIYFFS